MPTLTFHGSLRGLLQLGADLSVGSLLAESHGEIHHGHVRSGHTEGHSSQLAIQFRDDLKGSDEVLMRLMVNLDALCTLPTALAAPVELGMMFCEAPRPPLQSLPLGPSTVFWVAVAACTVVIRPSRIPKLSLITLARGARQLVVQEALDTI